MKKLLLILCFLPMFSFGGTIYKVLSDTVFIGSIPYRTATGELLLFNNTKDTTESVLYNTGSGKTEFKKVRLIRLNDSTYVFKIGTTVIGDSIKIHSGGSGGGGGSGTVTDFIFTDGNGFDGTVTNSTTTPTLSLVGDTIYKFASVDRLLDSLIDVNARIKNGDSIYYFRTFTQLKSAMSAHTLKGGASYQMTDFTTIYDQPDFHANGTPKDTVVTKTASVEHLVFIANSDSTFDSYVSSIEYPSDRLTFDWNYVITESMSAPAKGRISERIDERNNRADYDFRKVLYLRYESSTGSGIFSEWKDNGEASQEFLTFNSVAINNDLGKFADVSILTSQPFILSNFVYQSAAAGNKYGTNCRQHTYIQSAFDWNVFNSSSDLTVIGESVYNYIGGNSAGMRFNGYTKNNYFGEDNLNVLFLGECISNSIWDALVNFTADDGFERNIQYGTWSNSTVGTDFKDGVIYGLTDSITAGNNNFKIDIKSGLGIVIGDDNSNINFAGSKHINSGNDFNGVKNVTFSGGINGATWTNFITTSTHPEMYLNVTKSIFLGGNGTDNTQDNVYSRYFNNSTDVITIID